MHLKIKLSVVLLLCFVAIAQGQTIVGHIYRFGTTEPIAQASVYYNGSMNGTSSNAEGAFRLTIIHDNVPLVISSIGYYSELVTGYSTDKELVVYLKPKVNQLGEVTIRLKTEAQKNMLIKMFRNEFIGTSAYAQSCDILNIDDIDLDYNKETNTFTAFCNTPILIRNKKLGYNIRYYLDKFIKTGGHLQFNGNYSFKEDSTLTKPEQKSVKRNRETVYQGSRMQFIRSLWSNTLARNGFEIFSDNNKALPADSIVVYNQRYEKFIHLTPSIKIAYNQDYRQLTYLSQTQNYSFINKDGFYGTDLSWAGDMTAQRVGDLLPFEYRSSKDKQ